MPKQYWAPLPPPLPLPVPVPVPVPPPPLVVTGGRLVAPEPAVVVLLLLAGPVVPPPPLPLVVVGGRLVGPVPAVLLLPPPPLPMSLGAQKSPPPIESQVQPASASQSVCTAMP